MAYVSLDTMKFRSGNPAAPFRRRMRLTDCCGTYSKWLNRDLVCKKCYGEVPAGQGDGTQYLADDVKSIMWFPPPDEPTIVHPSRVDLDLSKAQTLTKAEVREIENPTPPFASPLLHQLFMSQFQVKRRRERKRRCEP